MTTWHVIPEDDLMEHELSSDCWCEPELDDDGKSVLWVHNSTNDEQKEVLAS